MVFQYFCCCFKWFWWLLCFSSTVLLLMFLWDLPLEACFSLVFSVLFIAYIFLVFPLFFCFTFYSTCVMAMNWYELSISHWFRQIMTNPHSTFWPLSFLLFLSCSTYKVTIVKCTISGVPLVTWQQSTVQSLCALGQDRDPTIAPHRHAAGGTDTGCLSFAWCARGNLQSCWVSLVWLIAILVNHLNHPT